MVSPPVEILEVLRCNSASESSSWMREEPGFVNGFANARRRRESETCKLQEIAARRVS